MPLLSIYCKTWRNNWKTSLLCSKLTYLKLWYIHVIILIIYFLGIHVKVSFTKYKNVEYKNIGYKNKYITIETHLLNNVIHLANMTRCERGWRARWRITENNRWCPQSHEEDVKTSEMASWPWCHDVVTVVTQWLDVIYSSSNIALSRRVC